MPESNWITGISDVCRLTLNDAGRKQVKYCSLCGAWICSDCELSSRGLIAFAKAIGLTLEQFKHMQNNSNA
jgi:hypothetical protein